MGFNPGSGSSSISGSSDAAISNPANADVLTYSTSTGKWQNKPAASADSAVTARLNAIEALATDAPWQLLWSDEFNAVAGSAVDSNKWVYETGGGGWGNSELEVYTSGTSNAVQDGNNLVITASKDSGGNITSARIKTQNLFTIEYGAIEARAYFNMTGPGFWPAIWMLGDNINTVSWPQCGEIDMMEWVSRDPNKIFGTLHGPTFSGGTSYGQNYNFGVTANKAWHVYRIEWRPGRIEWFIDGISYFVAKAADSQIHGDSNWVYDHPFFLIINLAVGGNFGGAPDGTTTYPANLIIDYLRVYKRKTTS